MTLADRIQVRTQLEEKYRVMAPVLHERSRRLWAASEARSIGYGGVSAVAGATGISRDTIHQGLHEISGTKDTAPLSRIRRAGGGRKKLTEKDKPIFNLQVQPVDKIW